MSHVISVFGSSAPQPGSADYEAARDLGRRLAEAGLGEVRTSKVPKQRREPFEVVIATAVKPS